MQYRGSSQRWLLCKAKYLKLSTSFLVPAAEFAELEDGLQNQRAGRREDWLLGGEIFILNVNR